MIAALPQEPILHPVILPVPPDERVLTGRAKVACLRRHARRAAALSAQLGGYPLAAMEKNPDGVPLPCNGIHWSLTHKSDYVAAVVSPRPVGIDIEKIKTVGPGMNERLADAQEWALASRQDLALFFRYWTAKEAVLKAVGEGLAGLSRCRVVTVPDEDHLRLVYEQTPWSVQHCRLAPGHLTSVTCDGVRLNWHLLEA